MANTTVQQMALEQPALIQNALTSYEARAEAAENALLKLYRLVQNEGADGTKDRAHRIATQIPQVLEKIRATKR